MESTPNERVREARKSAGMSQAALAKAIGVAQPTITWLEKAGSKLTERTASQIASACGVELTWLLTGSGPMEAEGREDHELRRFCEKVLSGEADSFKRSLVSVLSRMTDEQCRILKEFVLQLADSIKGTEQQAKAMTPEEEAAQEAKEFYQQRLLEKRAEAASEASGQSESDTA